MEFKKCNRCGCFYMSNDDVCENCAPKDKFEMNKLKDFCQENPEIQSINSLSINTGITAKNITRYLKFDTLSELASKSITGKINV